MTRPDPARPDIHARITRQIIDQLEAGVRPWSRPWNTTSTVSRPLRHDGTPYSGINVVLLWAEAAAKGYTRTTWMTFRQARALGGCVRKGETASMVVYARQIVRSEASDDGDDIETRFGFLKAYSVFNLDQIDGLDERYHPPTVAPANPDARISEIEAFFAACRADGRRPCFREYCAADVRAPRCRSSPQLWRHCRRDCPAGR